METSNAFAIWTRASRLGFGRPIHSIAQAELLEQRHYAGNWDVLRPATELKEYNLFMAEDMRGMLHEAERIMEGWLSADA